jgi:hypothetical protein
MAISYSKLFVGISLPALCTWLASLLLSISANAQTIRPTTQKEIKVFDPTPGNSGNIGIRAAAGTLSYTLTMPAARPTANQVLSASAVTGGNVSLTWATPVSGTVTSVGLSTGTTGSDVNVSGSPITSSGTITLNIPTASATNTGKLSSTDWNTFNNKQNTISLTTNLTSGVATLSGTTLNIPQYQAALTNPVTGTGTQNYLSKFATAGTLTNSLLFDDGTNVGIGTPSPQVKLHVADGSHGAFQSLHEVDLAIESATQARIGLFTPTTASGLITFGDPDDHDIGRIVFDHSVNRMYFTTRGGLGDLSITSTGDVGIGTLTPTARLDVSGAFGNPSNTGTTTNAIFSITSPDAFPSLFFGLHSSASGVFYSPWIQAADRNNLGNFRNLFLNPNGGNVAIGTGTITPTARLEIRGVGTTSATTALEVDNNSGDPLLVVKNDGSVGIGTTSPRSPLEIQEDNSSFFRMVRPPAPSRAITDYGFEGGNGGIGLYDYTNRDYRWWVSPTGDVGIGTTSPDHKLDIEDNVNSSLITRVQNLNSSSSASSTLRLGNNTLPNLLDISGWSSGYTETVVRKRNGVSLEANGVGGLSISAGNSSGVIRLFTGGQTESNQRLTILSDGNVGIGTLTPTAPFTIERSQNSYFPLALIRNTRTGVQASVSRLALQAEDFSQVSFFSQSSTDYTASPQGNISFDHNNNKLSFSASENRPITLLSSGGLDIGTDFASVSSGLRLDGIILHKPIDNMANYLRFSSGGAAWRMGIRPNDGTYPLVLNYSSTGGTASSPGSELLSITTTGKVSVGDTDPVGRFEVKAGSNDVEVLEIEDDNESTIFKVTRDGVIRAAKGYTGSGTRALHVSSAGTLTTTSSDIRLKTNIEVIPNALQKVMGLRGVTYNWKDRRDTTRVLGMIAQEMLKVAPELVFQNNNGYYGIHYAETTGLLVEAIKEQQKIIDQLKTEQAATGVLIRQLQLDLQAIRKLNTAPKD